MKKRILIIIFSLLLLTGCSNAGNHTITIDDKQDSKPIIDKSKFSEIPSDSKSISKITISEIGGEESKNHTLTISQNDNAYIMCKEDYRTGKTTTYYISDSDYQSILSIDLTDYLNKQPEVENGLVDTVDRHIEIQYDDGTTAFSEVYIQELWNKIYELYKKYEPIISTAKSPEPSELTNSSSDMYFKEPESENIVYDEEHGLSYVKNQLLISTSLDTERSKVVEMLCTGDYGEVQIVGEIALTGDYQVEFSEDHSLSEMQEIADYYMVFPFVENVTLNFITETVPAKSDISEVEDGWIAKFNGGSGEITFQTYVYKEENGYRYINTTSTTVSYGSPQWTERVTDSGTVLTKEEIVQIANDNGSEQYVLFPDDTEAYKISDFLSMD